MPTRGSIEFPTILSGVLLIIADEIRVEFTYSSKSKETKITFPGGTSRGRSQEKEKGKKITINQEAKSQEIEFYCSVEI